MLKFMILMIIAVGTINSAIAQNNDPVDCNTEDQRNGTYHLICDVYVDRLKIEKIIINRGNCEARIPDNFYNREWKFGDTIGLNQFCKILEVQILIGGKSYVTTLRGN